MLIINDLLLINKSFFQLGMRNYHLRRNSKWCPAINIGQLYTLIPEETRLKYVKDTEKAVVIDIVKKVNEQQFIKSNISLILLKKN